MKNFGNYKGRLYGGAAMGVLSLCLAGIADSASAQSSPQVLPPVAIDAPQQRARVAPPSRKRATSQRAARVTPTRNEQPPAAVAPPSTLGTTHTIGTPAPAYAGGQVATGGTLGLLGSTSVMNTPFSTVSYTSQLIENQQARTAADTLINDASVRTTTGANGFDDTLQIRGFAVPASDVGFNGLYGLVAPNHVETEYVDRIELLKGPGALVNGMAPGGSVGGGVNIITKHAGDQDFDRLTAFFMSAANYGLHLEDSHRYGANKEWGVRFNGVIRNGEASIDGGNWRTGTGALGLDYNGARLRWSLDIISQNDDTKNFRPQFTLPATATAIPVAPDARSNWFPGSMLEQRDNTVASRLEYDLTNSLTVYANIGYRDGKIEQNLANGTGLTSTGNFTLTNAYYDAYTKTVSGNTGLRAKFDTGFVSHSLNVAFSGYNQEAGYAYETSGSVPSNIYNPSPLPAITAARALPSKNAETTLTSAAIADTMSILNDSVMLTLGVRRQNVEQDAFSLTTGAQTASYNAGATSPLAGIVVKPLKNVSLYANYAEGLSQGTIVGAGYSNVGAVLAPYKSKQAETGVKVDWGTITTTAALFQITRPSQIVSATNALTYDGEQRNRGIELNAYGLLMPGLRGMVSATFLRPELTSPTIAAQAGNDAAGTPEQTFSGSLDWDTPWIAGLALNGRVIYTSGSYLTSANTVNFPSWTRVDIGARYTTTALTGKPVTFRANIENVGGANYWLTTGTFVTVGSPRTYILSAAFDF